MGTLLVQKAETVGKTVLLRPWVPPLLPRSQLAFNLGLSVPEKVAITLVIQASSQEGSNAQSQDSESF
jgi:hypothetical protein